MKIDLFCILGIFSCVCFSYAYSYVAISNLCPTRNSQGIAKLHDITSTLSAVFGLKDTQPNYKKLQISSFQLHLRNKKDHGTDNYASSHRTASNTRPDDRSSSIFKFNPIITSSTKLFSAVQSDVDTTTRMDTSQLYVPIIAIIPDRVALSDFTTKPMHEKVTWNDVMAHVADRVEWENIKNSNAPDFNAITRNISMRVLTAQEYMDNRISQNRIDSSVVMLIGMQSLSPEFDVLFQSVYRNSSVKAIVPFNCSQSISQLYGRFGDYSEVSRDAANSVGNMGSWIRKLIDKEAYEKETILNSTNAAVQDLWLRRSSDDLLFLVLVLIDSFTDVDVRSVKSVTATSNTGLKELTCMCKNCLKEMIDCFSDETCRKALDCLANCKGNDQVCSYRCITSHESPQFQNFAYCILQRNNCMGYKALSPSYPNPLPMTVFSDNPSTCLCRGQPLTHEVAEDIFIGHLKNGKSSLLPQDSSDLRPWSWKVVCGQNPAYDYFSCQHQLFYRDKDRPKVMWYDPVFKVTTLYDEEVWRRRHYRVRRAKVPGQFFFSVIDNGVASNENWRILDCADDLSWGVFYYGGAASAAGTSYTGALVVSNDGHWPEMTPNTVKRINDALAKGGIMNWELFEVRNDCCDESQGNRAGPAPLGID